MPSLPAVVEVGILPERILSASILVMYFFVARNYLADNFGQ